MKRPSEMLSHYIEWNYQKAVASFLEMPSPYSGILEIIRQIDIFEESIHSNPRFDKLTKEIISERYRYGWSLPVTTFLKKIANDQPLPPYCSSNDLKQWADSAIQVCGKLELSKKFVNLEKAALVEISSPTINEFIITYKSKLVDVEHYERLNFEFAKQIAFNIKRESYDSHMEKYPHILGEIKKIVKNPLGQFISYTTTQEIDVFYSKLGYFHLIRSQEYEDFAEEDTFGGIPYKKYLDFVEELAGVALKHRDCCYSLLEKHPKTDPYNIFTYCWHVDKTVSDFAAYLDSSHTEMDQMISCVTLAEDNLEYFRNEPGFIPPPFINAGDNLLIRSMRGSLYGAVNMLKRELKRKFPSDYFKAVNNRESRFRNDLYIFFAGDRFIRLNKEINIKGDSFQTDIDAVIFDKKTKTLGIFQLKWQDIFGTSLKERYSRISNMYPKSIEWIDKVTKWISTSTQKEVISKLNLDKEDSNITEIADVFLFIIARNHIHFSGQALDGRAAWASWYQIIHSTARIKATLDDPIRELFVKLKFDSPEIKAEREGYPETLPFTIELENYKLSFLGKIKSEV